MFHSVSRMLPSLSNVMPCGEVTVPWTQFFGSTFGVFGTPNCGKGEPNQVITVGHGSPVCAFRGVEIFGGEA